MSIEASHWWSPLSKFMILSSTCVTTKGPVQFATGFSLKKRTSSPILMSESAALAVLEAIAVTNLNWEIILAVSSRASFIAFNQSTWSGRLWGLMGRRGMSLKTSRVGTSPFGPVVSYMVLIDRQEACSDEIVGLSDVILPYIRLRNAWYCSSTPSALWLFTLDGWNLIPGACNRLFQSSV